MVTFVLYKTKCLFSGGVPLPLPPPETEVFRSPGSLHHPRPLHHLEPAGRPGGVLNSHLDLTWISPGSHLDCQVEGGRVRLFLNCQAADSTNIGRHQVSTLDEHFP